MSLGNPPTFLQLNQNPCLLQKLKLTFVNGLDGVAAVAVKCHLPPPVTVVSLRVPATFSRCLCPPVLPRLGKEVNRQRLQIRCHRRSCLMLHNPSKEPVCPMAQSSSVISARPWNPRPPIEHIHAVRSFPSSFVQSAPHPSSSSPPLLSITAV